MSRIAPGTSASTFIVLPSSRASRTIDLWGSGKPIGNRSGRATGVADGAHSGKAVTARPDAELSDVSFPQPARTEAASEMVKTAAARPIRKASILRGSRRSDPGTVARWSPELRPLAALACDGASRTRTGNLLGAITPKGRLLRLVRLVQAS